MPRTIVLEAAGLRRTLASATSRFTLEVAEVRLRQGDQVALVGQSGSGKSTLLGLLGLALRPDAGRLLRVAGVDALALWRGGRLDSLARLRAQVLGFVPQTSALLPYLSVGANIALPQQLLGRPDPARVEGLAARLGIADLLRRRPRQTSVGQRQRAAVARALAHRPALLLADEPTASVHPSQADEVLALLRETAAAEGAALLIATHDADRAAAAGFMIAACEPGRDSVTRVSFS
jgi:putative ABC transport system ATP-binding protein